MLPFTCRHNFLQNMSVHEKADLVSHFDDLVKCLFQNAFAYGHLPKRSTAMQISITVALHWLVWTHLWVAAFGLPHITHKQSESPSMSKQFTVRVTP